MDPLRRGSSNPFFEDAKISKRTNQPHEMKSVYY